MVTMTINYNIVAFSFPHILLRTSILDSNVHQGAYLFFGEQWTELFRLQRNGFVHSAYVCTVWTATSSTSSYLYCPVIVHSMYV